MNTKKPAIVALVLLITCLATEGMSAGTVLTYSGKGIWSQRSQKTWAVGKAGRYSVDHTQRRNTALKDTTMEVIIYSTALFNNRQASTKFRGTTSGKLKTDLGKGTYYLRFESSKKALSFDISGSVKSE